MSSQIKPRRILNEGVMLKDRLLCEDIFRKEFMETFLPSPVALKTAWDRSAGMNDESDGLNTRVPYIQPSLSKYRAEEKNLIFPPVKGSGPLKFPCMLKMSVGFTSLILSKTLSSSKVLMLINFSFLKLRWSPP